MFNFTREETTLILSALKSHITQQINSLGGVDRAAIALAEAIEVLMARQEATVEETPAEEAPAE